MSNISNTHSVVNYASGVTKPLDGQRLAKVTYKVDKKTGIKPDSKAVSIPVLTWGEVQPHLNALQGEFLAVVHKAQDGIIRAKVESGAVEIPQEAISINAVVAYMMEESSRITGEVIKAWFTETVADSLLVAIADKMGIQGTPSKEQESKLEKAIKGYEDTFAKLASGAAMFTDTQKEQMLKVLELVEDEEDAFKVRFTNRLTQAKVKDEELLAEF